MRVKRVVFIGSTVFFVKAAAVILIVSIFVRIVSGGFLNNAISGFLLKIVNYPGFAENVVSESVIGGACVRKTVQKDGWLRILQSESSMLYAFSPSGDYTRKEDDAESVTEFIPWTVELHEKENSFPIQAICINPISKNGYEVYEHAYVKNDSSKKIDMEYLVSSPLPFKFKGKGPHVLIVHTHGSEAYFPDGKDSYTPTDVERTEDKRYNVIRVGDELEEVLKKGGLNVVHDRNIYDSPTYNGSYTRTLAAISEQMKKTPSIKVIIDIHRDAMTTKEGVKYKTIAEIDGKTAAQIMIVMGTGESGLPHPDWAMNLRFAALLQNRISKKYPGLMRPVSLRKERFNMHVTTGSMLIEVGTSANTLQEALYAIRLFGSELLEHLKSAKA